MVVIIDYNIGNIKSVQNLFKKVGCADALISGNPEDIEKATKLILPGVGHFDYGMNQLHKSGLVSLLNKKVLQDKVPILGICIRIDSTSSTTLTDLVLLRLTVCILR